MGRTPPRAADAHRPGPRDAGAHLADRHITQTELRRHTNTTELANGYLNRFLFVACRRVRLLPEGGNPDPLHATGLRRLLAATLKHARRAGQLRLDEPARQLWREAYARLAQREPGLAGHINARAEAHTIRLALIYALTDGASHINEHHLRAALALQDYAARSAAWALQDATGDPIAEQIHNALTANPDGLTRTQISDTLQHNQPASQINQALHALTLAGRATPHRSRPRGCPDRRGSSTAIPPGL